LKTFESRTASSKAIRFGCSAAKCSVYPGFGKGSRYWPPKRFWQNPRVVAGLPFIGFEMSDLQKPPVEVSVTHEPT
jgi:hypothetical protein